MKKTFFILASILVAISCGKQPAMEEAGLVTWTFSASPATKASIADGGAFSWNAGDQIAIWDNTTSAFVTFTTNSAQGVFTATAPRTSVFTKAVYPASLALEQNSVILPEQYTQDEAVAGKTFPMIAMVQSGSNYLSFSHAGAILRFTLKGVIPEMTTVKVSSNDQKISGTFSVSENGTIVGQEPNANDGVIISISLTEKSDLTITIPMPLGSYNYKIEVGTANEPNVYTAYTESAQSFERKKLYNLGNLDFYRGNVLLESGIEGTAFTVEQDNPYAWQ